MSVVWVEAAILIRLSLCNRYFEVQPGRTKYYPERTALICFLAIWKRQLWVKNLFPENFRASEVVSPLMTTLYLFIFKVSMQDPRLKKLLEFYIMGTAPLHLLPYIPCHRFITHSKYWALSLKTTQCVNTAYVS